MIGPSLPSWVEEKPFIKDDRLNVVGRSEMSADRNEYFIAKAALMDAEVKLIYDAPTEFRVLTQNSLTGAGIDSSEYVQIQTSLREVVGLTGIKQGESTCRKYIRYGESRTSVTRICWHQASVNITELRKAYLMTLRMKYGDDKANKFDDLMKQELDKINDNQRFANENFKQVVVQDDNPSVAIAKPEVSTKLEKKKQD